MKGSNGGGGVDPYANNSNKNNQSNISKQRRGTNNGQPQQELSFDNTSYGDEVNSSMDASTFVKRFNFAEPSMMTNELA